VEKRSAEGVLITGELQGVREALGVPLRVARLAVPLADIEQRLASDVTSGRREDLREAGIIDRCVGARWR